MQVKVKKNHPDAVIPAYAKHGDACFDLTAVTISTDGYGNVVADTGLAFEIPWGHVGLVFPRSSVSKTKFCLRNSVGVIDAGYRGSVTVKFGQWASEGTMYSPGDRVAQMMILPLPTVSFDEVDELSQTDRGAGGYGSTGK